MFAPMTFPQFINMTHLKSFNHIRLDCPLTGEKEVFLAIAIPPEIIMENNYQGVELLCRICGHMHAFYMESETEIRVKTY